MSLQLIVALTLIFITLICLFIFSKSNIQRATRKTIFASRKCKNLDKFIESKKYEFDKLEALLQFILTIIIALFIGFKISGIMSLTAYVMLGYVFVFAVWIYIGLNRIHSKIIYVLYFYSMED